MSVADTGRRGGVRHTHHRIHVNRVFYCELLAHCLPGRIYQLTVHYTVRPGKIDKFKNTQGAFTDWFGEAFHAVLANTHDFTRFDFPDEFGADVVEGTALGSNDKAAVERTETQRADSHGSRTTKRASLFTITME